jgi:hypothetical protein
MKVWNRFWCWMGWHKLIAEVVTENDLRAGSLSRVPWYVDHPGYWVHCEHCNFTVAIGAKGIR